MRPSSSTPPGARSTRRAAAAPARLLASVTGPAEALVALAGGADVIDLKDPSQGPLGACPPHVLREVVRLCAGQDADRPRPATSAAIGDLWDGTEASSSAGPPALIALAAAGAAACGVDFIKVGVRITDPERATAALRGVARAVRDAGAATRIVAATYADLAARGRACDPELLVTVAARAELDGCLIDTAVKDGRTLLDCTAADRLVAFVAACREAGLRSALAGSIRMEDLPRIVALGPDYIGARGALCAGGRDGRFDPDRLGLFRAALSAAR
jgi:hypothetical protein